MTATDQAPPTAPLADRVLEAYRASERPLTFAELKKLLPKPTGIGPKNYDDQLREAILAAQREGKIHRWSARDDKDTPRYSAREERPFAEELARRILSGGDLPPSRLVSEIEKRLPKVWPVAWRSELVEQMAALKKLYRAGNKLSRNAPDANSILDKVLSKGMRDGLRRAGEAFAKAGLDTDALLAALRKHVVPGPAPVVAPNTSDNATAAQPASPRSEVEQLILKGMVDIEPMATRGATVPLAELRRLLPAEYREPATFDAAIRSLVASGAVTANKHVAPVALSDAERAELVSDNNGGFIVGIERRAAVFMPMGSVTGEG